MIINCPCCEKKFEINENLIPEKGRLLQCGFCDEKWFFNKEKREPLLTKVEEINEKFSKTENLDADFNDNKSFLNTKNLKTEVLKKKKKQTNFSFGNFLSYLLVAVISSVALIILIDTFKSQLYVIFPRLELILFNLYETLKDIELFVKDLI